MADRRRNERVFAETYSEARRLFIDAVEGAGGTLNSQSLPERSGPKGEPLATDIAWFGPAHAERVLVTISGTHGQEFFSGAAGQLNWVRSGATKALPEGVAVCLVHALNPYGAAYNSRGNENFVDLNRNYFSPGTSIRPNRLYAPLYELLFTKDLNERILDEVMAEFYAFVEDHDTKEALTAMGGGQDTHPAGTLFCGTGDEASTMVLRQLVDERLRHAQKIALIDWHTGLGEYGALTVMVDDPLHTDTYRWACTWWGGSEASEAIQPKDTAPDTVGMVRAGMADHLQSHGVKTASAVMEIGTVDNEAVLAGLLIDRWLRFECKDTSATDAIRLRTMMMERLNPSLPSWRTKVLEHSSVIYEKSILGLSLWAE